MTNDFIFQIAAISPMEFHILDTSLHIKIETRKQLGPRSGPVKTLGLIWMQPVWHSGGNIRPQPIQDFEADFLF